MHTCEHPHLPNRVRFSVVLLFDSSPFFSVRGYMFECLLNPLPLSTTTAGEETRKLCGFLRLRTLRMMLVGILETLGQGAFRLGT
jgi:hypothetical protein